jgi:hypothetical protein
MISANGTARPFARIEREIFAYAVRSMSEFAILEESESGRRRILLEADTIDSEDNDFWVGLIQTLRRAHAQEWHAIVGNLPSGSWVQLVARGLA